MPEDATVLVPGKLLGSGLVSGKRTVAAYSVSSGARVKIEQAGGRVITIRELMNENPKGTGCRYLAETTYVYDASDKVLGRLASHVANQLLSTAKAGDGARVIIGI